jgi:hypothetical protein
MDLKEGSITDMMKNMGPEALLISPTPHSKVQLRMEIVQWVAEAKRPFSIVEDVGFIVLMKTGRLHIHLPSAKTVSRDTRAAFVFMQKELALMLKVCQCASSHSIKLKEKKKTTYFGRSALERSALQPTPGHPPTTRILWL